MVITGLTIIVLTLVLRALLCFFFQLRIGSVNLLLLKINKIHIVRKQAVISIRSVRLSVSLWRRKKIALVVEGLDIGLLEREKKQADDERLQNTDQTDKTCYRASEEPLNVFNRRPLVKRLTRLYIKYLRFLELRVSDLTVHHDKKGLSVTTQLVLCEVLIRPTHDPNRPKVSFAFRSVRQEINEIQLLDTFYLEISTKLNLQTGDISRFDLTIEFKNITIPIFTLLQKIDSLKQTMGSEHPKSPVNNKSKDYYVEVLTKIIRKYSSFVNLFETLNFSFLSLRVFEIALCDKERITCKKYHPLVYFDIQMTSFVSNIRRMHFDSPGFGLAYDYRDKPLHALFNLTGLSLSLYNIAEKTHKDVMEIPSMNLIGSFAFQNYDDLSDFNKLRSKGLVSCHASNPIIDLSTSDINTVVVSLLDFYKFKNLSVPKNTNSSDSNDLNNSNTDKNYTFSNFVHDFPKLWPMLHFKLTVENPLFLLKSYIDDQYYRLLVTKATTFSASLSTRRTGNEEQSKYLMKDNFEVKDFKIKYFDTSIDLDESVFYTNNFNFRQELQILPHLDSNSNFKLHSAILNLDNLYVLNGINAITTEMISKIKPQFIEYKTFKKQKINHCIEVAKEKGIENPCGEPKKPVNLVEVWSDKLVTIIPSWITKSSFTSYELEASFGARSLFLYKTLMKVIDPQSKNDLVRGELRKVILSTEKITIDLLNQLDNSTTDSSLSSSLEDDDRGLFDSDSSTIDFNSSWNLKADIQQIALKVFNEKSSQKDVMKKKTIYKCPIYSINIFVDQSACENNRVVVDVSAPKVEAFYSIITHFATLSAFHLLRNTIFEFLLDKKKVEKTPAQKLQTIAQVKQILTLIDFRFSLPFYDLIVVLPDRFKLRIEMVDLKIRLLYNSALQESPLSLKSKYLRLCAESPSVPGYWARILNSINGSIDVHLDKILEKDEKAEWISLSNETSHVSIPHQFIIYKVFENISIIYKTTKQMRYSMRLNTNELCILPSPKKPEKIPKLNIKSKTTFFSMEDDPFEAQLGVIFQIGLLEQRSRYEKTLRFDEHVERELKNSKAKPSKTSTFNAAKIIHSDMPNAPNAASIKILNKNLKKVFHAHNRSDSNVRGSLDDSSIGVNTDNEFMRYAKTRENILEKLNKLREGFSTSWISRIKSYKAQAEKEFQKNFNYLWGNLNTTSLPDKFNHKVLDFSRNPHLFNLILQDLDVDISKPSFGYEGIPDFIYDVGKGQPKDTKYTLCIPLNIDLRASELRIHLRDYPLPLVYMPPLSDKQPKDKPAIRIHGDMIIGEAMIRSQHEVRHVFVPLVPGCKEEDKDDVYSIEVPKTVTAIKFFTKLDWEINSTSSTKVTWGSSYQPCLQQIMLNLDNFTKPPFDPSEKVGFWDKIRANFHARLNIVWGSHGKFNILIKGSKDPYDISGKSAGFVVGLKDDVSLTINKTDTPQDFARFKSKEISFFVPNNTVEPLLVWSRPSSDKVFIVKSSNYETTCFGYYFNQHETPDKEIIDKLKSSYIEKKAINLTGGVELNIEMAFERKGKDGKRTFESKPHYDVLLSNKIYVKDLRNYDAYKGFRTNYIHLGFELVSINPNAYNTLQLTPITFEYFFTWWHMFSTSLPVRHGKLFSPQLPSKKFGNYLYTIKYKADVQPLYISHIYRDHEQNAIEKNKFSFYGLKCKTDKFLMDLHQRRELTFEHNPKLDITKKGMRMKFHIGKIGLTEVDVRTFKAKFEIDSDVEVLKKFENGEDVSDYDFQVFDNDQSWFDTDDFKEIGMKPVKNHKGLIEAFPLMHTPRFLFFKKNDHDDLHQVDIETGKKVAPFGFEPFHKCQVLELDSATVQVKALEDREKELLNKIDDNKTILLDLSSKQRPTFEERQQLHQLRRNEENLKIGLKNVKKLKKAFKKLSIDGQNVFAKYIEKESGRSLADNCKHLTPELSDEEKEEVEDLTEEELSIINDGFEVSKFINKFAIHNVLIKWNNQNRNILFRYAYLIETRSQFSKHMKYKALNPLNKIIENDRVSALKGEDRNNSVCSATYDNVCSKLKESLANDRIHNFEEELRTLKTSFETKIHDNYSIKLISPQIQLQTEEEENSCVMVVAPKIHLKIIAFDTNTSEDSYEENIIEQRYGAVLTNASIFVFYQHEIETSGELFHNKLSYGSNTSWPPWIGAELCYDGSMLTKNILLDKTSIVFSFQKPDLSFFSQTDSESMRKLSCDLTSALFTCDSKQYYSLYCIIMNLLLYKEPGNAEFKHKESKLLMKFDLNNIRQIKDRVLFIQDSIRKLERIEENFSGRRVILDDVETLDADTASAFKSELISELLLLMRTSLLGAERSEQSDNSIEWHIRADDIKLKMLDEDRVPFVDVYLSNSVFRRLEGSDRSNRNLVLIENIEVINLEKDSMFPVLFSSFEDAKAKENHKKKLEDCSLPKNPLILVNWVMNYPAGGIPVIRKFDILCSPIQISIEQKTGDKLMKYAFAEGHSSSSSDSSDSDSDEDDSEVKVRGRKSTDSVLSRSNSSIKRTKSLRIPKSNGQDGTKSKRFSTVTNGASAGTDVTSLSSGTSSRGVNDTMDTEIDQSYTQSLHPVQVVEESDESDEELEEMMERASHFMSIISLKLNKLVICITYRGTGAKRLINVSDFVLHVPDIHVSNKIFTLLDMTLYFKREIIKALLSHTGSLITNKLTKRSKRQLIQKPLMNISGYAKSRIDTFREDVGLEE